MSQSYRGRPQQINEGQDTVQHVVHRPRGSSHSRSKTLATGSNHNHTSIKAKSSRRKSVPTVRRSSLPAYVNPFHRLIGRRPWRLSTSSRSRPRSRSRSRPDDSGIENLNHGANASPAEPGEEKEEPDQESPGGPDRNLPASFTPGDETDENCNEQENDMEDDSNHLLPYQHQDDDYSNSDSTNHPVNLRSLGSLGPRSSIQKPALSCAFLCNAFI